MSDSARREALFAAVVAGDVDEAERLLAAGPSLIEARDASGRTLIHAAFMWPSLVARLLELGAPPDLPDASGTYPLQLAARWVQADTIRHLLRAGAEVNRPDASGQTPLHWAVSRGRIEVARALLDAGADAELPDRSGRTLREIAYETRNEALVRLLAEEITR